MTGTLGPTRRALLAGAALAAPALLRVRGAYADVGDRLAELERRHGGRLGVAILDTGTGKVLAHRGDERFAICSTGKAIAAAFVLARAARGEERLDRRIAFAAHDLVAYSPLTAPHAGKDGMTLEAICAAALTMSDNSAMNLMLASFGGPAAATAFLRRIGDDVTRLDRREPELNDVAPGELRDTTTPRAMAATLRKLVLGPALPPAARDKLAGWLVGCRTGGARLRAGCPGDWRVGDKTGTGPAGEANDVAVVWPPGRAPLVVTAYYKRADGTPAARDAALADVGRLVSAA